MMSILQIDTMIDKCSYKVSIQTMRAIIKTESDYNPLAINLNGGFKLKHQPQNYLQAINWVNYLEYHHYNIDIGLAQVNIKNAHKFGFKARDMLDACTNIKLASVLLHDSYVRVYNPHEDKQVSLYKALSEYNTGNYYAGIRNGYVNKIIHHVSIK